MKGELSRMPNLFDSINSARGVKKTETLTPKDILHLTKKKNPYIPPIQKFKNF